MFDQFNRDINYLRISVTDRCNLRCVYCVPEDRLPPMPRENLMTFEQITEFVRIAAGFGISKVRLTGGEPLLRQGIADLASMIKKVAGISHLALTTNGILLAEHADSLRSAGMDSINISLDTLDPSRYELLTRGGDIGKVFTGIEAAAYTGVQIKINMVILDDTTSSDISGMRGFCEARKLSLQTIQNYKLSRRKKDTPVYDRPPKCHLCNRLRLLSDGTLKPCLHSDDELKVDFSNIEHSIKAAILRKPFSGQECLKRNLSEIGG